MMYCKIWSFLGNKKAAVWALDVGLLLLVLGAGFISYVSVPQLNHNLPAWLLLLLVPVSARAVRINFARLDNRAVASVTYFWFLIPLRRQSTSVGTVATGRSSDDLDKDDEIDLCPVDDGEVITFEIYNARSVGMWMRKIVQELNV